MKAKRTRHFKSNDRSSELVELAFDTSSTKYAQFPRFFVAYDVITKYTEIKVILAAKNLKINTVRYRKYIIKSLCQRKRIEICSIFLVHLEFLANSAVDTKFLVSHFAHPLNDAKK